MRVEIAKVDLYRYELPLTSPLRVGGSTLQHRRGLLVRFETKEEAVGWGDAAPLPGFSAETLVDAVSHARSAAPHWVGTHIPDAEGGLHWSLQALSLNPECSASLRFATESAVVSLLAMLCKTPEPEVLGEARSTVELNALIPQPVDDGPGQAARYREQGYRAVKVKVGRESTEKEAEALGAIRHELGDEIALRADANRAWSLEEALTFAEATRDLHLAYVEEPLADPSQLEDLIETADLPVALDETTREVGPSILRDLPSVSAVILKPTLLGGIRPAQRWGRMAQEHGITPVVSATYESGIGLRMLVAMAAVGPDTPVGLSTYDPLAADVLRPPLRMDGPTIDVESIVGAPISINEDRLERIDTFSS